MRPPEPLAGKRVLVTGATGFIGTHLVRRLAAEGADVQATSRRGRRTPGEPPVLAADLTDDGAVAGLVEATTPDLVVHQAAFTHVGRSFRHVDDNIQVNVQGTVNLLNRLGGKFGRFVYVGSGDVYGRGPVPFVEDGPVNPASPYAVSKYAAERFCRMFHEAYGWPVVCARPFNVFGPGQSVDRIIPELIAAGLSGRPLPMTEGRQTREFTYIDDLVDALVLTLTVPGIEGRVLNLGSGHEVSIRDLATEVTRLVGSAVTPRFGALPYRPNETWRMVGDATRARELLGWQPATSLTDGLTATIGWYRSRLAAGSQE